MEENKTEKKGFWKKHKWYILSGAVVAVGVTVGALVVANDSKLHAAEGQKIIKAFTDALDSADGLTDVAEAVTEAVV